MLLGTPFRTLAGSWLLPLAALGLADSWTRESEERLGRRMLLEGCCCALLSLLVVLAVRGSDPQTEWRRRARTHLEPSDVVLSHDEDHLYLLNRRWGVEAWHLSLGFAQAEQDRWTMTRLAELREAAAAGRRVVVDDGTWMWPAPVRADLEAIGVWNLTPEGLVAPPR